MIDFSSLMRRDVLQAAAVVSAIAALPALAAGEPPPETKRIRLLRFPFGSNAWTSRTAAALGLASTLRPRGRPKLEPED